MDLEANVRESANYAANVARDLGRLILLVVLSVVPIVNLIVIGYFVRVIEGSPRARDPPPLREFGETWFRGLRVAIVVVLYLIIPIIIFGMGWFAVWNPREWMPPMGFHFGLIARLGALAVLGLIITFLVSVIMFMAVVHMIKTGDFGRAFDLRAILGIISGIGYGKYFLWVVIIALVALIIAAISSIPVLGWLISLVLSPLFGVFVSRSASQLYAEGRRASSRS